MSHERDVRTALNTPRVERTERQEKLVFDASWVKRKELNHRRNIAILTGRVATNSGLTFFEEGRPRGEVVNNGNGSKK